MLVTIVVSTENEKLLTDLRETLEKELAMVEAHEMIRYHFRNPGTSKRGGFIPRKESFSFKFNYMGPDNKE